MTDHPVTAAALKAVMDANPQLSEFGYVPPRPLGDFNLKKARAGLRKRIDEVRHAYDYLLTLPSTTKVTRSSPSSYGLKHLAEHTAPDGYITNGALIAAAFILDLPVRVYPGSPNLAIGVRVD